MPYSIERKYLGIGKETTRGTAVAPTRYIAVYPDTELDYKLNLIEDELVRGVLEKFPPRAGTKEGTGRIRLDVQCDNVGELLLSLLGSVSSVQQGTTPAYKHTFAKSMEIRMPSYTLHIQRGLNAKQYSMSVVKSMIFTKTVDGKLTAEADILFKTEEAEAFTLSPTWTTPKPFMFYENKVLIDGVVNTTSIKEWSITIDNGSVTQRVLKGIQDIHDILTFAKLLVSGTMSVYFEDEAQRNKFLANTSASLELLFEGAVISGTYKETLRILLSEIHYTAYPFGELDGLLGASVAFNAYYSLATGKTVQVELMNTITSY